jgi:hypothetical protein
MAIRGINSEELVPYIPLEERSTIEDQTVIWIRPKNSKMANESAARYMQARREGSRGRQELDVKRLNEADVREIVAIVAKVENYYYSSNFSQYQEADGKQKLWKVIEDRIMLEHFAQDIPYELLMEIIDVAQNMSKLTDGEKKS